MEHDWHVTTYYTMKYQESIDSVFKGSQWADKYGEIYTVKKKTDCKDVRFTSNTFGWETGMSIGTFLHTMRNKV